MKTLLTILRCAIAGGADFHCLSMDEIEEVLVDNTLVEETTTDDMAPTLFSFPAQCNFSGVQLPLELAEKVKYSGKFKRLAGVHRFVTTGIEA